MKLTIVVCSECSKERKSESCIKEDIAEAEVVNVCGVTATQDETRKEAFQARK